MTFNLLITSESCEYTFLHHMCFSSVLATLEYIQRYVSRVGSS